MFFFFFVVVVLIIIYYTLGFRSIIVLLSLQSTDRTCAVIYICYTCTIIYICHQHVITPQYKAYKTKCAYCTLHTHIFILCHRKTHAQKNYLALMANIVLIIINIYIMIMTFFFSSYK